MRFLWKKSDEDTQETESKGGVGSKEFRGKKGLTPEELAKKEFLGKKGKGGRKKKFEIKPWSKVERLWILGILSVTVGISAVLGLSAREWKLPNLPRLKLPSILSEETIIIEGNGSVAGESTVAGSGSELVKRFYELTNPKSGVYGFYVIELATGVGYGVSENEAFESASLNKLPVMVAMYKAAEEGEITLSSKYVLREEDKMEGAGSLQGKPAGTALTYKDLVMLMGKESDNTAFNIGRRVLGEEKIISYMREWGFSEALLTENTTTPKQVGMFFKALWEKKLVSEESTTDILSFLTNTNYEDWIAKDSTVRVAHKYGTLPHVKNDAGIVYANDPYILVVMSKGIVETEADEIIPQISSGVYSLLSR